MLLESAGNSRRNSGSGRAPQGKTLRYAYRIWVPSLLICIFVVAVTFAYVDVPTAFHIFEIFGSAKSLERGFATALLLPVEASFALALVVLRITRGPLSAFREAIVLACVISICAYAINDSALKLFFGVSTPAAVLQGKQHAFNLLSGSSNSSFPSGHMVLAGAFAGVFMRLYRASIVPCSALLLIAAALLIAGEWHFVSDVVAGTFIGISAGLLAGEVWSIHRRHASSAG